MTDRTISRYRILEKLGAGGMGIVYKAEDPRLKRIIALKVLNELFSSDDDARERLEREAQAAAALNHPNIIGVYEIGDFEGRAYIAMEYVEGQSLDAVMGGKPLPIEQAVEFAIAIADALALTHRKGIIHRDIKPRNVMVSAYAFGARRATLIKVLDFGLAKLVRGEGLAITKGPIGTLGYMSPEQATGSAVDHRTDIFSLGAVFYEMLSGAPPFAAEYEAAVLYSHVNEEPPPLARKRPEVLEQLECIVNKAMMKNPDERYQSMEALLADLASYQYNPQILAIKAGPAKKSVAVLPFDDMSPGAEDAYLADGVTEEITVALSRNGRLRVIARTSMMQYKGHAKDVREIGNELGTSYIIEGSVRRHGRALRVAAQLIDARDGSHLWADTYDGEMDDIFAFQDRVARQVADVLEVSLGGEKEEKGGRAVPRTKAYESYLQGKLLLDVPTLQNLDRSLRLLTQALDLEPRYAAAYGSMAVAYLWYVDTGMRPDPAYLLKAEEAAGKALAIDETQPDALYAIANLKMKRGDIEGAFDGFGKVLAMDPNHGHARMFRACLLLFASFFEEALREADVLLSTDPHWPLAHWLHSTIRLHQGIFNAAVAEYEMVVTELPPKLVWLALAYRYKGDMERAWGAARKLREIDADGSLWPFAFAFLEGAEGKGPSILGHISQEARASCWNSIIEVYWIASFHAMADERDEAFRWLERGIALGNRNYLWFKMDPNLECIRCDVRFQQICERAFEQAERLREHFGLLR
jgi:TolB-like protein/predicted Ser/Thr protein kinase